MSRRNKATPKGGQKQNTAPGASAVATMDAFSNPLFHLGYGSQSPLEATEYPLTRMTDNYALLNALYRDNWVVQNVVGLMVDDMLREWYKLRGTISPEYQDDLDRVERVTQIRARLNEGLRWGRLYGGAAGLILIRGQEGMLDQPLDLESIMPGAFAGLMILDRWVGVVPEMGLVQDVGDPDFGLPDYYMVNNAEGKMIARVHHSRIVRFTGRDLPYLEKIAELYWGESEVEALYKDVVAHDNVSANMAALTFQANINTQEVQNLEQLFSLGSTEQQRRFWNTMQAMSVVRSNFGVQLINKGDAVHNTQYTFTGLQEVYESMCLNLCGASHYPMTKLFGRSPAGMNATGQSDLQNYYDYVDSQREASCAPRWSACFRSWPCLPGALSPITCKSISRPCGLPRPRKWRKSQRGRRRLLYPSSRAVCSISRQHRRNSKSWRKRPECSAASPTRKSQPTPGEPTRT